MESKPAYILGAVFLLAVIFGVPAVLVPTVMDDVPERSQIKVITNFEEAARIVNNRFSAHREKDSRNRLSPLPTDTNEWIEAINPMGRKAPGGGLWILPEPDPQTGAIGLVGNSESVTIRLPAYRELEPAEITIRATH